MWVMLRPPTEAALIVLAGEWLIGFPAYDDHYDDRDHWLRSIATTGYD
jgi:hypothetical protein